MMTPFPPKTPMQMRLQAERPVRRRPAPAGPIDPAARPLPASEGEADAAVDVTIDWLAHTCPEPGRTVAAGRIPCREPDEGQVR